jgi:hypothetical protein
VSDRDAFRAEQQARRDHGLKARHETREARAVRKAVAEEIAALFEESAREPKMRGTREGAILLVCATTAREIGSRDPA